jgi:hypothetical protein
MANTTNIQTKTLFELLNEANVTNATPKSILTSVSDMVVDTASILTGSIKSLSQGLELANSYISEELDLQVASRTSTKVECTIQQFQAIARLTALGASAEEAINLATSYRR